MFIAVEGCIGSGKSTVANGLATHRNSRLLLEAFELNPFLRAFATDPEAFALETEFAFLLIHFHQLKGIRKDAASSEVISDFHLGKDLLYEQMNISNVRTKTVFRNLYDVCSEQIPQIDLMICLSAPHDLIIDRIRRRHRDFELDLDPSYYIRLNEVYEDFFGQYNGPKLLVRMDEHDFIGVPELFGELSAKIDARLLSSSL